MHEPSGRAKASKSLDGHDLKKVKASIEGFVPFLRDSGFTYDAGPRALIDTGNIHKLVYEASNLLRALRLLRLFYWHLLILLIFARYDCLSNKSALASETCWCENAQHEKNLKEWKIDFCIYPCHVLFA